MMRTLALLLLIAIVILSAAWVVGDVMGTRAQHDAAREPWPETLGTLTQFDAQPRIERNESAQQLIALAEPIGIVFVKSKTERSRDFKELSGYVKAEQGSATRTIGEPPPAVREYLEAHADEIDAVRDHLLRAPTVGWERDLDKGFDAPLPNLVAQMHLGRVLVARALLRARSGDADSWNDLEAVWRLAKSAEPHPDMVAQLIALSTVRMINAAAWKLPAGDGTWLDEMHRVDWRRRLLRAYQHDAWLVLRHAEGTLDGPLAAIGRPYLRWSFVNLARHQREAVDRLARIKTCVFDGETFHRERMTAIPQWNFMARVAATSIGTSWQRMLRYEAEREAAANAMRVANGGPIVTSSVCADGAWSFVDGNLRFNRDLPKVGDQETVMPLSLALR